MTAAREHLQVDKLTDKAKDALDAGSKWLLDPDKARFRIFGSGLEICENTAELTTAFLKFFEAFPRPPGELFNALRCLQSDATILVPRGTAEFIPVSGSPVVSDVPLQIGQYMHLTKDTPAKETFYCLLLLSQ